MNKNNISYLLREGLRGVFLHGFRSFASVCVTVACLIIMGTFSLVLYNLHVMIVELERENEVLVYVDEDYSEAKAKSVGSQINLIENVHNAEFVSREDALADFVEEQEDKKLFDGIDAATFRDRFVVTLEDNTRIEQTVLEIGKVEGVADVVAHYEIAEGFQVVQRVMNVASGFIILLLFVVSLFIISNTVKLSMYDRKEEIAIMKMVGATDSFIRLPFVVEGLILGLIGAFVAFFLQWGLYGFLESIIERLDTLQLLSVVPFAEVVEMVIIIYLLTGIAVGVLGGLLSIRKFLKV